VSVIGMETHLAIALVAVLAWAVVARRPYLAGVVCGLCCSPGRSRRVRPARATPSR
jgi:hypothetical protein